jgi:hypothetical protein
MSYKPNYNNGDWLAICDACGRQFPASSLRMRWDNLMTCEGDWEPRQPQDFVKGVADLMKPPWVRSESQDQFIPINFTTDLGVATLGSSSSLSLKVILYSTSKQELDASSINSKPIG